MFTGIKQRFTQLIALSMVFVSCNNTEAPNQEVTDTTSQTNMEAAAASFPVSMVNNKKILPVACQLQQAFQIQHIIKTK